MATSTSGYGSECVWHVCEHAREEGRERGVCEKGLIFDMLNHLQTDESRLHSAMTRQKWCKHIKRERRERGEVASFRPEQFQSSRKIDQKIVDFHGELLGMCARGGGLGGGLLYDDPQNKNQNCYNLFYCFLKPKMEYGWKFRRVLQGRKKSRCRWSDKGERLASEPRILCCSHV